MSEQVVEAAVAAMVLAVCFGAAAVILSFARVAAP